MRSTLTAAEHETLLEDGKPIVITTDLQGRLTYTNSTFIAVGNYAGEDLIGRPQKRSITRTCRRKSTRTCCTRPCRANHGAAWSSIAARTAAISGALRTSRR